MGRVLPGTLTVGIYCEVSYLMITRGRPAYNILSAYYYPYVVQEPLNDAMTEVAFWHAARASFVLTAARVLQSYD